MGARTCRHCLKQFCGCCDENRYDNRENIYLINSHRYSRYLKARDKMTGNVVILKGVW